MPFTAQTRMSGMDLTSGRLVRKGAADSVRRFVEAEGGMVPLELLPIVERVSKDGATPLVVIDRPIGATVVGGRCRLRRLGIVGFQPRPNQP